MELPSVHHTQPAGACIHATLDDQTRGKCDDKYTRFIDVHFEFRFSRSGDQEATRLNVRQGVRQGHLDRVRPGRDAKWNLAGATDGLAGDSAGDGRFDGKFCAGSVDRLSSFDGVDHCVDKHGAANSSFAGRWSFASLCNTAAS